jgi:CYTH domain-containing protein
MKQEIEKKYLIRENGIDYLTDAFRGICSCVNELRNDVLRNGERLRQGYLAKYVGESLIDRLGIDIEFSPVEFRLRDKAGKFYFTIKGDGKLSRDELEIAIGDDIFEEYWEKTKGKRVEKFRLEKPFAGYIAEFDVYRNRDMVVAEVEVPTTEQAKMLANLGKDVTGDKSYKNKNLAK